MSINATSSLALYAENGSDKLDLAVEYAGIMENVAANTISGQWKNTVLSGDPKGGLVIAHRFVNAKTEKYGKARQDGHAAKLRGKTVPVPIDIDRELYEEVEEKDVLLSGVEGLIESRLRSQEGAIKRENERLFFEVACLGGTAITFTGSTAVEKLGEIVRSIETTNNEYVDGVDRVFIKVALDTATYEAVHTYLDPMKDPSGREFFAYHGVEVKPSTYLPSGVTHVALFKDYESGLGSVALPMVVTDVQDVTKVQNSAAYSFGGAHSKGCKAVMPDLIKYAGGAVSGITLSSAASSTAGAADITITLPANMNMDLVAGYKYKAASSSITLPAFGAAATG